MDLGQIYMSSPDWIKGLMVILPFVTLYATARLFAPRRMPSASSASVPAPYHAVTALTSAPLPALDHETETDRLDHLFFAEIDRMKEER